MKCSFFNNTAKVGFFTHFLFFSCWKDTEFTSYYLPATSHAFQKRKKMNVLKGKTQKQTKKHTKNLHVGNDDQNYQNKMNFLVNVQTAIKMLNTCFFRETLFCKKVLFTPSYCKYRPIFWFMIT